MKRIAAVIMICFAVAGCSTVPDKGRKLPLFYKAEELQMKYRDITCVVEGKESGSVRPCDDPALGTLFGHVGRGSEFYEKYKNQKNLSISVVVLNTVLFGGLYYASGGGTSCIGALRFMIGGTASLEGCLPYFAAAIPGTLLAMYLSYDAEKHLADAIEVYNSSTGRNTDPQ